MSKPYFDSDRKPYFDTDPKPYFDSDQKPFSVLSSVLSNQQATDPTDPTDPTDLIDPTVSFVPDAPGATVSGFVTYMRS